MQLHTIFYFVLIVFVLMWQMRHRLRAWFTTCLLFGIGCDIKTIFKKIKGMLLHQWRIQAGAQYAVKAQTSLAPLSLFPGSRVPTAHLHQCCRFQSYANSHAIAYEIYKRNLQNVNHIPGIHDNGRPVTFDFNSV